MKTIITIQHTQSIHHTNGMVGSWTDWELSEKGLQQAEKIGSRLKAELNEKYATLYSSDLMQNKLPKQLAGTWISPLSSEKNCGSATSENAAENLSNGSVKIWNSRKKPSMTECFPTPRAAGMNGTD